MSHEIVPTVSRIVVLDEADAARGKADPIALVEVANDMSHLEYAWDSLVWIR